MVRSAVSDAHAYYDDTATVPYLTIIIYIIIRRLIFRLVVMVIVVRAGEVHENMLYNQRIATDLSLARMLG